MSKIYEALRSARKDLKGLNKYFMGLGGQKEDPVDQRTEEADVAESVDEVASEFSEAPLQAREENGSEESTLGEDTSDASEILMEKEMLGLYQRIDGLLNDQPHKVLQFMGCQEGEGTSTIVREFARTASTDFGKVVLIIDADRLNGGQHLFFNVMQDAGWEDVLMETAPIESAIYEVAYKNVMLCPTSPHELSAGNVFDLQSIDKFLKEMRARFDIVIIDSPPSMAARESFLFSRKADGVVMVVEADRTRWPVLNRLKEQVAEGGGKVLGIVLNKRKYFIPASLYARL